MSLGLDNMDSSLADVSLTTSAPAKPARSPESCTSPKVESRAGGEQEIQEGPDKLMAEKEESKEDEEDKEKTTGSVSGRFNDQLL